jgi:hypothetical protein
MAAAICRPLQGHWEAMWPLSWHQKQLPVRDSSMRSSAVSLVYCLVASTLIGGVSHAGVLSLDGPEVAGVAPCTLITG